MFLIKVYQKIGSPFLGKQCKFYPTCSQYALEAIEKHGSIRGSAMSILRILRCNPFSAGGYDPVKD
jgi:putative membrane protein insertion efficiency factor